MRYYHPVLARFISADSIIPGQSDKAGTANPQNLNRYTYVNNNPVNKTDPTGYCPWCVAAAVGAVVGASIAYGAQVAGNINSGMDLGHAMTTNIDGGSILIGAAAGAVVGGTFGLASAEVIPGVTLATTAQMGTAGALGSAAGSVAGQLASTGEVNPKSVAVAAGVGFTAGALAPIAATTAVGASALGAVANTTQYALTQKVNGEAVTGRDIAMSAATGAVGGFIGGSTKIPDSRWSSTFADGRMMREGDFTAANLTTANAARSFGGSFFTNYDIQRPFR